MGLLSKEGLLTASDLIERDVDLPALGGSRPRPVAPGRVLQTRRCRMRSRS